MPIATAIASQASVAIALFAAQSSDQANTVHIANIALTKSSPLSRGYTVPRVSCLPQCPQTVLLDCSRGLCLRPRRRLFARYFTKLGPSFLLSRC